MVGTQSLSSGAHSRDLVALPTLHLPDLILRSASSRVSKDEGPDGAAWFETALTRLLTMRG
ncbi:hypothetical protein CQ10_13465 [Bradyrhizobium valentinum]|nr:hypothetical protein CQ10_13465 [Bradyrhizobium valentinum]